MTSQKHPKPPERPQSQSTPDDRPALSVDWDLYSSYLEESDASDEDKQALLETLFDIVLTFVDLGFRLHPLQQCGDAPEFCSADLPGACGQNDELRRIIVDQMVELQDAPSLEGPGHPPKPTASEKEKA